MLIAAWQQWVGINSRMNPRLLAPGMGVDAVDFRPGSGDLRPWNLAPVVHTLAGLGAQAQSIHRMAVLHRAGQGADVHERLLVVLHGRLFDGQASPAAHLVACHHGQAALFPGSRHKHGLNNIGVVPEFGSWPTKSNWPR